MEILKIEEVGVEAAALRAAAALAAGGIIVYPTDTLYGIGVDALNVGALNRLRELKVRDSKKPLSILVSSLDSMRAHGVVPPMAEELAVRFLPGALTLVVPAREHLPAELTHNGSIGIRIPDDAFARALALSFSNPVTATSANRSGMQTPDTIAEIVTHFGRDISLIDLLIDAGPRAGGTPSTVVQCTQDMPYILREGAISRTTLGL